MEVSFNAAQAASVVRAHGVKISVITACRNSFHNLDDCLDSVASQTHPNLEHIVIDGNSRDGCQERLSHQGARLTLIGGDDRDSIFSAWNRGIERAQGDVLCFLNADDTFEHPDVLATVAQALADPWLSAVYGNVKYVKNDDLRIVVRQQHSGEFSRKKLAWGWAPPTTALFVRRSWYRRIGGFSTQLPFAADYDVTLRLFAQPFFKSRYIGESLVRKRVEPLRPNTAKKVLHRPREELQAMRRSGLGGVTAVAWKNLTKLGLYL
jgi:glycosyltransferase